MKIYMIVLDGAADRKIKRLGNKTPLETAYTPYLDNLVSNGCQSMIDVIGENIIPESDSGAMALLSYPPQIFYPGRGTLEGIGTGCIPTDCSYAAFRVNYASYNPQIGVLDRRTSRGLSDDELQELSRTIINKVDLTKYGVDFGLISFGHHRGILYFYSNKKTLSGNVSNTDPGFEKKGVWGIPIKSQNMCPKKCFALDDTEESKFTAEIVNIFSEQVNKILSNHFINKIRVNNNKLPANYLLIRDGGNSPKVMPKFRELYNKSLVMYGQLPAEKAIANLIGERFEYSKSLDLQLDKKFLIDIAKTITCVNEDVIFIHLKGPDEPGHDNDPIQKVNAIEMIDKYFVKTLVEHLHPDDIVIVTCDHATPCELMLHSNDKVPILISGKGLENDSTTSFNEIEALRGSLSVKKGIDILPYVMKVIEERYDY